jgi:hypothetical protein
MSSSRQEGAGSEGILQTGALPYITSWQTVTFLSPPASWSITTPLQAAQPSSSHNKSSSAAVGGGKGAVPIVPEPPSWIRPVALHSSTRCQQHHAPHGATALEAPPPGPAPNLFCCCRNLGSTWGAAAVAAAAVRSDFAPGTVLQCLLWL